MPTRIENIILRARDTLADTAAKRYTDARLLRLVSEGQKDIIKQTQLLRYTFSLFPLPDIAQYSLPDDTWLITRASYKGEKIPFLSHDEMDTFYFNMYPAKVNLDSMFSTNIVNTWETDVGAKPEAIIYDRLNPQVVRVYPIISEDILTNTYTFEGGNPGFFGGEEFGVVTDITGYSFTSEFGVLTDFLDPFFDIVFASNFGVVTKITEVDSAINIQYKALAPEVESVNDTLIISPLLDVALKHYIVAQAYLDDVDVQFQALGAAAFKLYERELILGKETGANNSTLNTDRATPYRGPFNA